VRRDDRFSRWARRVEPRPRRWLPYIIVLLSLGGALLYAWLRSRLAGR